MSYSSRVQIFGDYCWAGLPSGSFKNKICNLKSIIEVPLESSAWPFSKCTGFPEPAVMGRVMPQGHANQHGPAAWWAIDLSLVIFCLLWGSPWCVAGLMIFKCLFRGNSGKLNCHIGRILQETKICMKKINEAQNVISWFKFQPCFACRRVSGLFHIYSVPHRSSVFWNWWRMGAKFVPPFPEVPLGQFCVDPGLSVCMHVVSYRNDKLSWDDSLKEFLWKSFLSRKHTSP